MRSAQRSTSHPGMVGIALLLAGSASADFLGLSIEEFVGDGWIANGYGATGLTTYRLYANFTGDDPDEGVRSVYGLTGQPILVTSSDGSFHNDPLGGLTAPEDLTNEGIWSNQWDTYVTIGMTTATNDATNLSPGFATATNNLGSNWSIDNGGWFVLPEEEQSRHVDGRVLLGQFVVAAGENVYGQLNLWIRSNDTFDGLTFFLNPMCCWYENLACQDLPLDECLARGGHYVNSCDQCDSSVLCCAGGSCVRVSHGWECDEGGGVLVSDCDECPLPCPGDIDRSYAVDLGDILAVLSAWGQAGGIEDLDGTGTVDFGDILVVLSSWGPCP